MVLVILGMVGLLIIISMLAQCTAAPVVSPTNNGVIGEKTIEMVNVTQTTPSTSTALSPTVQPLTATPTSGPTATHFPTVPSGIPILPPGGSGAATNLQAQPGCRGAEPIVYLSWDLAAERGSAQRVDLATFIGGFEAGVFEMTVLHPEEMSVVWDKVSSGVLHFWRVLTWHQDGWVTSEVATFNGLVCTPDMVTTSLP
jgi:hypothetical protein